MTRTTRTRPIRSASSSVATRTPWRRTTATRTSMLSRSDRITSCTCAICRKSPTPCCKCCSSSPFRLPQARLNAQVPRLRARRLQCAQTRGARPLRDLERGGRCARGALGIPAGAGRPSGCVVRSALIVPLAPLCTPIKPPPARPLDLRSLARSGALRAQWTPCTAPTLTCGCSDIRVRTLAASSGRSSSRVTTRCSRAATMICDCRIRSWPR